MLDTATTTASNFTSFNSSTLVANGYVSGFKITSDDQYLVYTADQDTEDVRELYSVPLAGGASTKLNGAIIPAGGDVVINNYVFTPDQSKVIYKADQELDGVNEIYVVPITGGVEVKLNGAQDPAGGGVSNYYLTPDGTHVVYLAEQNTAGVKELYSVSITGGTPTKLNSLLPGGGSVAGYNDAFQ